MATLGWLAEVLLVGGTDVWGTDLHKVDEALGLLAGFRGCPEIRLVGGFQGPLPAQLQLTGSPAQEGVPLP